MHFRTPVELPKKELEIRHSDSLMLFGSCFAENIGNLLLSNKFPCDVNPFGILYNPLSVAEALQRIRTRRVFGETELFERDGLWHSYLHHGAFSDASPTACVERINRRLLQASDELPQLDLLVVTWGTAWAYALNETGEVVGNCHKQPERLFSRRLLGVEEIVTAYVALLKVLRASNPKLKVLLTVSPIRHLKDGLPGNQIGKSVLLLAADALRKQCPACYYFPSYEIMMDELRDYRFYADDMLHPSPVALAYLWECFATCYFGKDTLHVLKEWDEIRKALNHKPFDEKSEAYRDFLTQIVLRIDRLKQKFPYFNLQKELEQCQARLRT